MQFTGTGTDPEGDTLTYDWNFGDGSAHSTQASPVHTYADDGPYTATLTVSDGTASDAEPVTINVPRIRRGR